MNVETVEDHRVVHTMSTAPASTFHFKDSVLDHAEEDAAGTPNVTHGLIVTYSEGTEASTGTSTVRTVNSSDLRR